jgi:hypothetical protein
MSILPLVTIYVRHTAGCQYEGDEFAKRCKCRKHLRWSRQGKQYRRTAGTRSWTEAERAKRELEDQLTGRVTEHADPGKDIRSAAVLDKTSISTETPITILGMGELIFVRRRTGR